ncbi:MAG: M28 family peptidase [Candidatus Moduliflexus flocculans]|nr:M28 family peptidase [Candidatus Moduliflexus flocculans]
MRPAKRDRTAAAERLSGARSTGSARPGSPASGPTGSAHPDLFRRAAADRDRPEAAAAVDVSLEAHGGVGASTTSTASRSRSDAGYGARPPRPSVLASGDETGRSAGRLRPGRKRRDAGRRPRGARRRGALAGRSRGARPGGRRQDRLLQPAHGQAPDRALRRLRRGRRSARRRGLRRGPGRRGRRAGPLADLPRRPPSTYRDAESTMPTLPGIPAAAVATARRRPAERAPARRKRTSSVSLDDGLPGHGPGRSRPTSSARSRVPSCPDEIVLLGGHLDSWDLGVGAHDDAAGCAAALEALALIQRPRPAAEADHPGRLLHGRGIRRHGRAGLRRLAAAEGRAARRRGRVGPGRVRPDRAWRSARPASEGPRG